MILQAGKFHNLIKNINVLMNGRRKVFAFEFSGLSYSLLVGLCLWFWQSPDIFNTDTHTMPAPWTSSMLLLGLVLLLLNTPSLLCVNSESASTTIGSRGSPYGCDCQYYETCCSYQSSWFYCCSSQSTCCGASCCGPSTYCCRSQSSYSDYTSCCPYDYTCNFDGSCSPPADYSNDDSSK